MKQILCRIDHEQKPVVFLANTLKNGQIKAWHDGAAAEKLVGIDYYAVTKPLSDSDANILAKKYAAATNTEDVQIRQRLPRVYRTIPNRLTVPENVSTTRTPRMSAKDKRKEAAKKRYEQEVAQTNADKMANEQLVGAVNSFAASAGASPTDETIVKIADAIVKALRAAL